MQYTEEQKSGFKLAYSQRRRRQLMLSAPLILIVFAASMARESKANMVLGLPGEVGGPLFLGLILAALLFSFRNWRCPACDKYLGKNFNPKHCPGCGVELHA
jgi:hypothetical protein